SAPPANYTLSLHDALPIYVHAEAPLPIVALLLPRLAPAPRRDAGVVEQQVALLVPVEHLARERVDGPEVRDVGDHAMDLAALRRSEEHTSELQSPCNLVCR